MASTYLTYTQQTPSTAEGQKFTWSAWVKKSKNGVIHGLWGNTYNNTHRAYLYFHSSDQFMFYDSAGTDVSTNAKYRDLNGWYHVVVTGDTTQSTSSDRVKIWINGELQTSLATTTYPSQNSTFKLMNTTNTPTLGKMTGSGGSIYYTDGYMSHVHFTQGYTYQASDFGETDSTTGEWKIKTSPSISNYGTNGFWWLKDSIATTDHSPNSNTFSVGGGTLTKSEDNPSNVFCTLNPLTNQGSYTFAHGNTYLEGNNTNDWTKGIGGTLGAKSGKYYWEVKQSAGSHTDYNIFGFMKADEVMNTSANLYSSGNMNAFQTDNNTTVTIYAQTGSYSNYMKISGSQIAISDGDVVSFALDLDNRKCWVAKNGVWVDDKDGNTNGSSINTSYPLWGTGEITADTFYTPASIQYYDPQCYYNFGNGYFGNTAISSEGTNASGIGKFEYDVPTGFTALSTKGLNE